ncbi:hypothetical protein [Chelatococcus sp.]|uniref:hypothetical protein n=1 Tax=Chelatococcus sp. TaxID=1953771 RepID=UPI0025C27250|nr:hypothetical protein [Chelatococcus sp.]
MDRKIALRRRIDDERVITRAKLDNRRNGAFQRDLRVLVGFEDHDRHTIGDRDLSRFALDEQHVHAVRDVVARLPVIDEIHQFPIGDIVQYIKDCILYALRQI